MKTITFISLLLLCFLLAISGFTFVNAQPLAQTRKPTIAASAAEGCLACPGSEWNDANNIKKKDGQFANTFLLNGGFCFQTSCYYSRGLMASKFKFSIPSGTTITGVKVLVVRKADSINALYDFDIQLLLNSIPSGNNKKSPAAWPLVAGSKMYGNSNDTWGLNLTPADVNNIGFGLWLQVQNTLLETDYNTVQASVDFVKMTVYYSNGLKQYEQVSFANSMAEPLQLFPNPSSQNTTLSLDVKEEGPLYIRVMNETGQIIWEEKETISPGTYAKNIDLSGFSPGMYLVQCILNKMSWRGIIVKE